MNTLIVTLDLDWACEPAIEDTLDFLNKQNICPTIFATHRSQRVESAMKEIEVGLHPFFDPHSSHGSTIFEVVNHVLDLPHNLRAFRCHRFANCNSSRQAMAEAGMLISSNVCTDLEIISPFKDRFGLWEVPIFLEDGGYLWRKHPLEINQNLQQALSREGAKVVIIHPMHFSINSPDFSYMYQIKQSINREEWKTMTRSALNKLKWKGRGIRDFLVELLQTASKTSTLGAFAEYFLQSKTKKGTFEGAQRFRLT
jgi:hypothetical protein